MKETKSCATCGRFIAWRRKWERSWDDIRFCSAACRRSKPGKVDQELEVAILSLLKKRSSASSICPSEAAREVFGPDDWRDEMERTRRAGRRLVNRGLITICQKGRVVDPSTAKGPIRLKSTGKIWSPGEPYESKS